MFLLSKKRFPSGWSFAALVFLVFVAGCLSPLKAAESPKGVNLERLQKDLSLFSSKLSSSRLELDELNDILNKINNIQPVVDSCLQYTSEELKSVNASLENLGPKVKGEALEVTRERYFLLKKKAALEKKNGQCKVLGLKLQTLREKLNQRQKELATKNLFYRQPDVFSLFRRVAPSITGWPHSLRAYLERCSGLDAIKRHALLFSMAAIFVSVFSAGLFFFLSGLARKLRRKNQDSIWGRALSSMSVRLPAAAFFGLSALFFRFFEEREFVRSCLIGILSTTSFLILLNSFISTLQIIFSGGETVMEDDSREAINRAFRHWKIFAFLLAFFFLMDISPFKHDLGGELAHVIGVILIPLMAFFFLGAVAPFLKRLKNSMAGNVSAVFLYMAVAIVTVSEWLGYCNLSRHFLVGTFLTYLSGLTVYWLRNTLHRLLDDFASGESAWAKKIRTKVGIKENEILKTFFWTKTILSIFLWGLWGIALFYFWSISNTYLNRVLSVFFQGFSVGKLQVVPARLIAAVFVFGASWAITSWIKRRLEEKLKGSYMSKSARDALVTLTGYSGFIIALILGLGVGGLEFSNLALIAGALSVGIGFGLQNIVNNFVSGLILLFERPIKRGDWIVVGQTEGYVKKISVRSTTIQTFDRSDVIVPNSELISSQVTNWMLGDVFGRLKIPVGVAYGSDTKLVKKILLDVARAHPMVITDSPDMRPRVYFWEFGDSSLNFRLDVFLKDIDRRRSVRSEINFAIDEAFRTHGITIPFPQRDVYIKEFRANEAKDTSMP